VVRLCQAVLDAVLDADPAEDMNGEAAGSVALDELNAVVGRHGMDFVRDGLDENLEEGGGCKLRRLTVDPGENELRGAVDGDEQKALAALVAQFLDVDMEVADVVAPELPRLFQVGIGQP